MPPLKWEMGNRKIESWVVGDHDQDCDLKNKIEVSSDFSTIYGTGVNPFLTKSF